MKNSEKNLNKGVPTNRTQLIRLVKKEMLKHKIKDYWSLRTTGSNEFASMKFGKFGTGVKVASLLLGSNQNFTLKTFDQISKVLSWFPTKEERNKKYKQELRKHGITDYWSLKAKGIHFFDLKFSIVRKGAMAFINLVLNRNSDLRTLVSIEDLAKHLGWYPTEEDKKRKAVKELAKHGITNYWILRYKIGVRFNQIKFKMFGNIPGAGKGLSFLSYFLKFRNSKNKLIMQVAYLDELAKWLGWYPTEEEKDKKYRALLKKHGIVDYVSLLSYGHKFYNLDFGFFGKGGAFVSTLLGIKNLPASIKTLQVLAEKLEWNLDSKKIKIRGGWKKISFGNISVKDAQEALAKRKITDYWSLISINLTKFQSLDFGPFGRGRSLVSMTVGRTNKYVDEKTFDEFVSKLGWKPTEEQRKQKCKEVLKLHDIVDYWSLMYRYTGEEFRHITFKGFGKQNEFLLFFLGVSDNFSLRIREKLATYLGWNLTEEQKNERYRKELRKHGLTTQFNLKRTRYRDFIALKFGIFGSGTNFLATVLQKNIGNKNRSIDLLDELAIKLKMPKLGTEDEIKDYLIKALASYGITDHWSLIALDLNKFRCFDFGALGNARSLTSEVLNRKRKNVWCCFEALIDLSVFLGWTPFEEKKKEKVRELLKSHNIHDYWSLMFDSKISDFSCRDLDIFGSGKKLVKYLFNIDAKGGYVSRKILEKLATYLGWNLTEEQKNEKYKEELRKHGLITSIDISRISFNDFLKLKFGIFGTGARFLCIVLNKKPKDGFSVVMLEKLCIKLKV